MKARVQLARKVERAVVRQSISRNVAMAFLDRLLVEEALMKDYAEAVVCPESNQLWILAKVAKQASYVARRPKEELEPEQILPKQNARVLVGIVING